MFIARYAIFVTSLTVLMFSLPVSSYQQQEEELMFENRIEMKPMNLALFEGNRIAARLNVKLTLQVSEEHDPDDVKKRLPQLRADFLAALSHLAKVRFKVNEPVEVTLIKDYLTLFAEKRLGEGVIDIFVQEVYVDAR